MWAVNFLQSSLGVDMTGEEGDETQEKKEQKNEAYSVTSLVSGLEKTFNVNITGKAEEEGTTDPADGELAEVSLQAKDAPQKRETDSTFTVVPDSGSTLTGRMLQSIQHYVNITGEKEDKQREVPLTTGFFRSLETTLGVDITGASTQQGAHRGTEKPLTVPDMLRVVTSSLDSDTVRTLVLCANKNKLNFSVDLWLRVFAFAAPESVLLRENKVTPISYLGEGGIFQKVGEEAVNVVDFTAQHSKPLKFDGKLLRAAQRDGRCVYVTTEGVFEDQHQKQSFVTSPKSSDSPNSSPKTEKTCDGIAMGENFTAVVIDGVLYGWGDNSKGQLGLGKNQPRFTELTKIPLPYVDGQAPEKPTSIAAGDDHLLVVCGTTQLLCTGHNSSGQLGLGHEENVYSLEQIPNFVNPEAEPTETPTNDAQQEKPTEQKETQNNEKDHTEKDNNEGQAKSNPTPTKENISEAAPSQMLHVSAGGTGSLVITEKGMYSFGCMEGTPASAVPNLVDLGLDNEDVLQSCGLTRKMIWLLINHECLASNEQGVFSIVPAGGRNVIGATTTSASTLLLHVEALPKALNKWW